MFFSAWSKSTKIIGLTTALAVAAVPVAVMADASNPVFVPKKKAKPKARKAAPKARSAAVKPAAQPAPVAATVYTPPQAPVTVAPRLPVPTVPVYVAPPPAPPAVVPAAAPMTKAGGNGMLLGLLGAAALIGVIIASTGNDDSPTSP